MALWNVPFLIRTRLRMAGFRMGGGGGGGGGVRIFFSKKPKKFGRFGHHFYHHRHRHHHHHHYNNYSLQKPDKISHGSKVVVIYFSLQNCILEQNTIIIFVVFLTLGSRFKSLSDIKVLRYKNYNSLVTRRPFPRMTRQKWLSGRLPMPQQSFKYYVRGSSP